SGFRRPGEIRASEDRQSVRIAGRAGVEPRPALGQGRPWARESLFGQGLAWIQKTVRDVSTSLDMTKRRKQVENREFATKFRVPLWQRQPGLIATNANARRRRNTPRSAPSSKRRRITPVWRSFRAMPARRGW